MDKGKFFSVSYNVTLDRTEYRPSVCYKLTTGLIRPVDNLVSRGLARIYPEEVRFVSGVAYPVKKAEVTLPKIEVAAASVKPAATVLTGTKGAAKTGKSARSAFTEQSGREF